MIAKETHQLGIQVFGRVGYVRRCHAICSRCCISRYRIDKIKSMSIGTYRMESVGARSCWLTLYDGLEKACTATVALGRARLIPQLGGDSGSGTFRNLLQYLRSSKQDIFVSNKQSWKVRIKVLPVEIIVHVNHALVCDLGMFIVSD